LNPIADNDIGSFTENYAEVYIRYVQTPVYNSCMYFVLTGSMQDYNYVYGDCMELTLEVSCCKYPAGEHLGAYWRNNTESMLAYIEQVVINTHLY